MGNLLALWGTVSFWRKTPLYSVTFSLNNSVWSAVHENRKLNYVELHWIVVASVCYSRVSTLTKMAFAADCDRLLLTSYWHPHDMQLMTATPHSDTSCTEEKDPSHIAAKNVSDVINHISRNNSPRWVQYCLFALYLSRKPDIVVHLYWK